MPTNSSDRAGRATAAAGAGGTPAAATWFLSGSYLRGACIFICCNTADLLVLHLRVLLLPLAFMIRQDPAASVAALELWPTDFPWLTRGIFSVKTLFLFWLYTLFISLSLAFMIQLDPAAPLATLLLCPSGFPLYYDCWLQSRGSFRL